VEARFSPLEVFKRGLLLMVEIFELGGRDVLAVAVQPQTRNEPRGRAADTRRDGGLAFVLVRAAEDKGFEPLRVLPQHAFQACAIGH
jgi:hypothetical protein